MKTKKSVVFVGAVKIREGRLTGKLDLLCLCGDMRKLMVPKFRLKLRGGAFLFCVRDASTLDLFKSHLNLFSLAFSKSSLF